MGELAGTILVTGGMGFIGSNFIRHILAVHADVRVVNLDKLTSFLSDRQAIRKHFGSYLKTLLVSLIEKNGFEYWKKDSRNLLWPTAWRKMEKFA